MCPRQKNAKYDRPGGGGGGLFVWHAQSNVTIYATPAGMGLTA